MYVPVTTEDFDTWIKAESRTFETRCDVIIGNTTYRLSGSGLSGDIISMQWNNVVCSNDGLQIGTSCMDEFRMEYRNNNSIPSLMNSEIHPYVGLVIPHENTGDVTVWIPLGVFYVTNTETNDEDRTFSVTAYDGMQKLLGDFDATEIGVTFPITAWSLLSAIATYFDMTVTCDETADDTLDEITFDEAYEGTYRDYVGWIAGLVGANAHMGRSGDLALVTYKDHDLTVPRILQHMGGATVNYGGSVSYTAMVSGVAEAPIYPSSRTGNPITYTNPYITTEELDAVCDTVLGESGITVTPCNVTWRGDPRVDAGDIVNVEDKDGNYAPVYVMERVMNITGGLSEQLNCYSETEMGKTLNQSPMEKKITQLAKETKSFADAINLTEGTFKFVPNASGGNSGFVIEETDGVSILRCSAGGLGFSPDGGSTYTNAITKNGINATAITTGTLNADLITAGTINASLIKSGTLDASLITVENLYAQGVLIDNGSGARVFAIDIDPQYGAPFIQQYDTEGKMIFSSTSLRTETNLDTIFRLRHSASDYFAITATGDPTDDTGATSATLRFGAPNKAYPTRAEGIYFSSNPASTTTSVDRESISLGDTTAGAHFKVRHVMNGTTEGVQLQLHNANGNQRFAIYLGGNYTNPQVYLYNLTTQSMEWRYISWLDVTINGQGYYLIGTTHS